MAEYVLDLDIIARFVVGLLPDKAHIPYIPETPNNRSFEIIS